MLCLLLARMHLSPNVLEDGTILSKKTHRLHKNSNESELNIGQRKLDFISIWLKQIEWENVLLFLFKKSISITIPFYFKEEIIVVTQCLIALGKSCFLKNSNWYCPRKIKRSFSINWLKCCSNKHFAYQWADQKKLLSWNSLKNTWQWDKQVSVTDTILKWLGVLYFWQNHEVWRSPRDSLGLPVLEDENYRKFSFHLFFPIYIPRSSASP